MLKAFIKRKTPPKFHPALRRIYYRFPWLRRIYYFPYDLWEWLKGTREALQPPRSKIFVGDGGFNAVGREFLTYFTDLAALRRDEKILDVGCGIGRMAVPLTRYLAPNASYFGFDVLAEGVSWCQKNISSRFANFHFQQADIYNRQYHPQGRWPAREYRFPYDDGQFDFVIATSVFTHLLPADADHYLMEAGRVLKPGGRLFATFFFLNAEARDLLRRMPGQFQYPYEDGLTIDPKMPEASIAQSEERILRVTRAAGMEVRSVRYGSWCGRQGYLSFQDILLAYRKNDKISVSEA